MLSVIHEYTILYSTRVYQRDKKWQDGILKFYELNRKVEVYNEDGVVIKTDFLNSKDLSTILNTTLLDGNQLKVAGNSLIMEIINKDDVHQRDVAFNTKPLKAASISNALTSTQRNKNFATSIGNIATASPECYQESETTQRSTPRPSKGSCNSAEDSKKAASSNLDEGSHCAKVNISKLHVRFRPGRVQQGSHGVKSRR